MKERVRERVGQNGRERDRRRAWVKDEERGRETEGRKEGEREKEMERRLVREGRHGVVIGCQCFPVLPTAQQPREIGIAYN